MPIMVLLIFAEIKFANHLKRVDMNYTIKITDTGNKAKSLVNMLKELADDYPFLSIYEDETGLSEVMEQELDKRYKYSLKS
jgi:hypothetical protein